MLEKFVDDMRAVGRALAEAPVIVAITVGLAIVSGVVRSPAAVLLLPVSLFEMGWAGTQQLWLAKREHERALPTADLWLTTWRYVGRYFALTFTYAPIVAIIVLAMLARGDNFAGELPLGARVLLAVPIIAIEIALTFVVPALALSTRSVGEAWRMGWRLLRDNWPNDAWYAIAPAVTLHSAYSLLVPRLDADPVVATVVGVPLTFVALVFRLAIAREYLRLVDVKGVQPM